MTANEYQAEAAKTLLWPKGTDTELSQTNWAFLALTMGLAGEVGEVVEPVKKAMFFKHELNEEKLLAELGDVLWYVTGMITMLNTDLSTVMEKNIAKIRKRHGEEFTLAGTHHGG